MNYVVITKLPIEQQAPFNKWLFGQTCPLVEEEGEDKMNCAYKVDYDRWLAYWKLDAEAPVFD
jgi:hypothetical protein